MGGVGLERRGIRGWGVLYKGRRRGEEEEGEEW